MSFLSSRVKHLLALKKESLIHSDDSTNKLLLFSKRRDEKLPMNKFLLFSQKIKVSEQFIP